jgi:hypothetical protein
MYHVSKMIVIPNVLLVCPERYTPPRYRGTPLERGLFAVLLITLYLHYCMVTVVYESG